MLFNSFVFVVFLAIVLPLYYALRHRWQNSLLLVASYVFYGWWDWRFLSLLMISTIVDYLVGRQLGRTESPRARKGLLMVSLCVDLGLLGFFKYFNFFVGSAAALAQQFGFQPHVETLNVILPVGISFYTFQALSYTVSVYRRHHEPAKSLVSFAAYLSFFPQLVAGPIERAEHLLPQIEQPRRVSRDHLLSGAQLILLGLLKKVAIADAIAPTVEAAFSNPAGQSTIGLLVGVYLFAIQIYCDFGGYSDIARGVGRLFGINLMVNFRQPYVSENVTEFWHRWHISLSSWLRDHLYIPLGGNRKGKFNTYRNLMITMLLGGLWHGAAWTFVIWGGLHGLYLVVHKLMTGNRKIGLTPPPTTLRGWGVKLVKIFVTFHLVCLAWVFFRAANIQTAWAYLGGIFRFDLAVSRDLLKWLVIVAFYVPLMMLIDYRCWKRDVQIPVYAETPWPVRGVLYAAAALLLLYVGTPDVIPFIYFQF